MRTSLVALGILASCWIFSPASAQEKSENFAAEQKELQAQYEKEQAEAQKKLQAVREKSPFQETISITVPSEKGATLGFSVLSDGRLAAISGTSDRYGRDISKATDSGYFHIVDAKGQIVSTHELSFKPTSINTGPGDTLYVAGVGRLAVFDTDGKKLRDADAPHLKHAIADPEKFAQEVWELHQEELKLQQEQLKTQTDVIEEMSKKKPEELSSTEKEQLNDLKQMIKYYEESTKTKAKLAKEDVSKAAIERLKKIHRVAVSKQDVFIVTNEANGHGFCVWRLTHELTDAKKIAEGLSGCCGQMDIQTIDDEIVIAENSRHRVRRIGRDGTKGTTFGKSSRTDESCFGGCCNPMNTCLDLSTNTLLTSESNGLVKSYKPDGTFVSVLGVAKVTEGCKNSAIGISPAGDRLYYLDVEKGQILVLERK
jgi:hypothetical protein